MGPRQQAMPLRRLRRHLPTAWGGVTAALAGVLEARGDAVDCQLKHLLGPRTV
jgi:hypothetical protein